MMRTGVFIYLPLLLLGLLSGCASRVSSSIEVPLIPSPKIAATLPPSSQIEISFPSVNDRRPTTSIADFQGRDVAVSGDVSAEVRRVLESSLREKGLGIAPGSPLSLQVEVRKWFATITGGVPARVQSEATLYVQVLDPSQHKIYSGSYQGNSMAEGAGMGDGDVRKSLGTAMSEAVNQVMSDQELVGVLSSY